jgi:Spy/CpxP family protein refolding chaperone
LFSLTFAADWGRGRGHGGSPGDEGDITTISELELADKQVSQIRALREAHLLDVKPFHSRSGPDYCSEKGNRQSARPDAR